MKAASSNSDLLNDLFAPPAGQTAAVQEDIFFSAAPSDSKRTGFISHRLKNKMFWVFPHFFSLSLLAVFQL